MLSGACVSAMLLRLSLCSSLNMFVSFARVAKKHGIACVVCDAWCAVVCDAMCGFVWVV